MRKRLRNQRANDLHRKGDIMGLEQNKSMEKQDEKQEET